MSTPRRPERGWRTPHGETAYSPDSLLRALTANPLDIDNLRPSDPSEISPEAPPRDNGLTRTLTFLVAIMLGFAVVVSTASLRENATAQNSPRAELQRRVEASRHKAEALDARQEKTSKEIAALQKKVLTGAGGLPADTVEAYEAAEGARAIKGPGLQVTVDDSVPLPPAPGTSESTVNRVTDRDLQIAVNGLWAAGAEGIAINGTRLTAGAAIRTAGKAVLVDFTPLSPPYVITAIGDPQALQDAVNTGPTGEYLQDLSSRFGIRVSSAPAENTTLPARRPHPLRIAERAEEPRGRVEGTREQSQNVPPSGQEEDE